MSFKFSVRDQFADKVLFIRRYSAGINLNNILSSLFAKIAEKFDFLCIFFYLHQFFPCGIMINNSSIK